MSTSLLTVSPSPHIHSGLTVPQIMRGVIIAMLPAMAFSIYNFGWDALFVTLVAVISCALFENLISVYFLKKKVSILDGSAVITGMLLAFNVPSNLPWHIIVIGSAIAMGIGKMSFGGLGNNPFNPALVGRVFLLISFPVQMTSWPISVNITADAITGATALGILKEGIMQGIPISEMIIQLPSYTNLFFGLQGGSLGEMSALALIVGMVYMLYRKIITWHIPLSMLMTVFIFTGIFWLVDPERYVSPVFHILTGGLLLGAIFMATDYVTSPLTHRGMLIFGFGIGVITVLIRLFGSYPEGVSFAILIMNAMVPMINKFTKPIKYGAKTVTT
ncbi:MAG: electron transport complex protein RnfD [Cyclobacteriaceae bacterium]|jgi:electron transport complex protein RnfD